MEKSLQIQLWLQGNILMNKLIEIRLHVQNDLGQMMQNKQITREQILDRVHDLEKQYQWLQMDLRSWTTQMKAYMRFVADGNRESDIKDEVPKTGALFDRLNINGFGQGERSLEKYLETHPNTETERVETIFDEIERKNELAGHGTEEEDQEDPGDVDVW